MIKIFGILLIAFSFGGICVSQTKPRPGSRATVVKRPPASAATSTVETGQVVGRTYSNKTFGFEITFPDKWLIAGRGFEANVKRAGFDISLKAPDSLSPGDKTQVDQALKRVNMLVTAYRSTPGSDENAIMRISVEDLAANPQIKDGVDYFDAIRAMYRSMKLPLDFKYSETQAEKLGAKQFAFLDTSTIAGKKRIYSDVRMGFAIVFALSYSREEDLQAMRRILGEGNFAFD